MTILLDLIQLSEYSTFDYDDTVVWSIAKQVVSVVFVRVVVRLVKTSVVLLDLPENEESCYKGGTYCPEDGPLAVSSQLFLHFVEQFTKANPWNMCLNWSRDRKYKELTTK